MTTVNKTYSLNKIKQLIDLNGDTTNFNVTFKVASKNGEPFDIIVADQTTLDNSPELEFKKAPNGQMSGNIIQDKGVYQNYFLVLKADTPCECNVEIIKKEIQGASPAKNFSLPVDTPDPDVKPKTGSTTNWKLWIIIGIVVVGAIAIYFMYKKEKKEKETTLEAQEALEAVPSHHPSPSPNKFSKSPSPSPIRNDDLVQRLKRLHMG